MKLRLIFMFLTLLTSVGQSELFKIVDQGVLTKNAELFGKSWKQQEGFVSGDGVGQFLNLKSSLKNSPFEINASLSLEKVGHTAAGIKVGSIFFGFDGANGLFIEGGGVPTEFFKDHADMIKQSMPFDFKTVYDGSKLAFFVNKTKICSKIVKLSKSSKIAIRPHRSAVKVYDFSVSGELFASKPLPYVFKSGTDGYHTYRIPAIVRSKKGTLLAFAEGRVNHAGDSGNLDIVLRRSTDNGKSWQKLIVVQDDGKNQCGNAAPVVDQKSGRIFMLSCGSTSSEHAVMKGHATREIYIQHSDDDGITWTKRRNISAMTRKENWRWYATGPCSGIQIREGKHKGRLVIPANHSYHDDKTNVYRAHSLYSDDSGETWHIGAEAGDGSNESQIAEAGKDFLYQTMRMQSHSKGMRGVRYSKDGGETWTELAHDEMIHCPRCQGSVIRDYSKKTTLIFSNPSQRGRREDMTIRVSNDGGISWPYSKTIFTGPAAYSDLVITKNDRVGILFEGGHSRYNEGIVYRSFSKSELLEKDPAITKLLEEKANAKSPQNFKEETRVNKPALIPTPQKLKWFDKSSCLKTVQIVNKIEKPTEDFGFTLKRVKELMTENRVKKGSGFRIVLQLGKVDAPYQKDEAYSLKTNAQEAVITANTETGLFYGVQTLRQLITHENGKTKIAHCEITDYPAFKIRGFMHDVGRNFISLDLLKKQIDLMSYYKYNIFHWHLSDHHGWRLESKIFPKLQADSTFQRFTGKYYTQKEFVDFIKYCRLRKITVIPELDSPGHSCAFRAGVGVPNMKDPKAKEAICKLIDEMCALVSAEWMPYIHLGTDEVRARDEFVNADYLPALFDCVKKNKREIIGWWKGMSVPGDTTQIQQSWAQYRPRKNLRHIDSRSNYVNHLYHLNFLTRIMFQQPCRMPHGDDMNLGGILCYWPDTYAPDENLSMINSPVWQSMVAYPEAVWTGIKKDNTKYWAMIPPKDSPEGKYYAEMEDRLVEHRDRFLKDIPFNFVKNSDIPWKLLGPMKIDCLPGIGGQPVKKSYKDQDNVFNWGETVYGGTIELRQPFGFGGHFRNPPKDHDKVYAYTQVYSPKNQTVGFWINFNTVSTSDDRAGRGVKGQWNCDKNCKIWVNGKEVAAPEWKSPGKTGKEEPIVDAAFTARPPTRVKLKKGWNQVLVCAVRSYKWHFTFCPVKIKGQTAVEVEGLKFSAEIK